MLGANPISDSPSKVTDCHVHLAALPDAENGCYISPKMLRSSLFRFLIWKQGLDLDRPAYTNEKYVANLLAELRASHNVGRTVLLGMDGVYGTDGKLDRTNTAFLISNDYVLKIAHEHPAEFVASVSVNPQRRDALEELQRCAEAGAKVLKWLPNAQQFDPSDRKYVPFYRELARLHIPLVSHVGYEFSLIGRDQSSGDPTRLRTALDEGVVVIAAHGCSTGLVVWEKFYPTFLDLVRTYANFYSDISALTLPNRVGMLLKLRRHPEVHARLLFGTDYPLPVFRLAGFGRLGRVARGETKTTNRFDRQHVVCAGLGIRFGSIDQILK